jgi:hypothetical protein
MSKEKQIEEMAKDISDVWLVSLDGDVKTLSEVLWSVDIENIAIELYNAGYRKQSENVIELPCNIGDSCYPLPRSRKPIVERKVSRITFTKRNIIIGYYENDGQYRPPLRTRTLGEDVFLTKAEAEAKMKGGAE